MELSGAGVRREEKRKPRPRQRPRGPGPAEKPRLDTPRAQVAALDHVKDASRRARDNVLRRGEEKRGGRNWEEHVSPGVVHGRPATLVEQAPTVYLAVVQFPDVLADAHAANAAVALHVHVVAERQHHLEGKERRQEGQRCQSGNRDDGGAVRRARRRTFWICEANSRVGDSTSTCVSLCAGEQRRRAGQTGGRPGRTRARCVLQRARDTHRCFVSMDCSAAMEKVAVFPVPLCACAMTSRPLTMGLMARCCTAEGFSKPLVGGGGGGVRVEDACVRVCVCVESLLQCAACVVTVGVDAPEELFLQPQGLKGGGDIDLRRE